MNKRTLLINDPTEALIVLTTLPISAGIGLLYALVLDLTAFHTALVGLSITGNWIISVLLTTRAIRRRTKRRRQQATA